MAPILRFASGGRQGPLAGAVQGFNMWWMPADRSGSAERLTNIELMQSPSSWTPDGKVMALTQTSPETGSDVHVLALDDPQRKPVPFAQTSSPKVPPGFRPTAAGSPTPRMSPDEMRFTFSR